MILARICIFAVAMSGMQYIEGAEKLKKSSSETERILEKLQYKVGEKLSLAGETFQEWNDQPYGVAKQVGSSGVVTLGFGVVDLLIGLFVENKIFSHPLPVIGVPLLFNGILITSLYHSKKKYERKKLEEPGKIAHCSESDMKTSSNDLGKVA